MEQRKKAAIYIRVSTDAQREEGYSIDAQKEALTAYCISKQISNYEYYIDGGFTGSNLNRPEMQRMIEDAESGRLSHCLLYTSLINRIGLDAGNHIVVAELIDYI